MATFAIVQYVCEVEGQKTNSFDYQVRYFESDCEVTVTEQLQSEAPQSYKNCDGGEVRWILKEILAVESEVEACDGQELVGFISGDIDSTPRKS